MAKRFQPLKEFGRSTKKPRLDVSIHKGRPSSSQSWAQPARNSNNDAVPVRRCPTSPPRSSTSNNNNFWDDDDDDVILLATQVAESQAAINKAAVTAVTNITESEITFSEFAPHVYASTSTQCVVSKTVVAPAADVPDAKQISELFDDDDDDDFAMLAAEAVEQQQQRQQQQQRLANGVANGFDTFRKPTTNIIHKEIFENAAAELNDTQLTQPDAPSQGYSGGRRQVATERQINFLMDRVNALKKENAKLSTDLGEAKSKMESKDGEAALLRDELRHMKQQVQTLKMEKILSSEAAKSECKTKIADLMKKVEAKETELQLRNVEYSVLKMRHADETQRLEMTMRNALLADGEALTTEQKTRHTARELRTLLRLRGLTLTELSPPKRESSSTIELSATIYEHSHERGSTKKQRTIFQLELEQMQTLLAQWHIKQQEHSWSESELHAFIQRTVTSVCKVFEEFWSYVHSLEFPKNCNVHPYHDYDLGQDCTPRNVNSLLQSNELYEEERALSLRRYVAALSVICRQLPQLGRILLTQQHGEYVLLQIAIDAITKLGFSREICEHFGVLEAFATLLHVLLLQAQPDDDAKQMELLVSLLKHLTFTRPSAWIFRVLSCCLWECVRLPYALSLLCVNSDERSFSSDRLRSLYRFSNDSCLLQVYAGLVEICFPLNTSLLSKHFELLAVICANHVRFVHYCFAKPPTFIHKLLPSYDDEEEEEDEEDVGNSDSEMIDKYNRNATLKNQNSSSPSGAKSIISATNAVTTTSNGKRCECYTKLCLSVVTLLFQLLRQWIRTDKLLETTRVAEVSRISVQLLHIIFCDNYSTLLFRDSEETTKHYLWLICKWWAENTESLHFNDIHLNFLRKLQNFHVMPKSISEEGNVANVAIDLAEWHSLTNDPSKDYTAANAVEIATKLQLMQSACAEEKFFEGVKGYAFNFE